MQDTRQPVRKQLLSKFCIWNPPVKWWTFSLIKHAVSAKCGRRNPDEVGMRSPHEEVRTLLSTKTTKLEAGPLVICYHWFRFDMGYAALHFKISRPLTLVSWVLLREMFWLVMTQNKINAIFSLLIVSTCSLAAQNIDNSSISVFSVLALR